MHSRGAQKMGITEKIIAYKKENNISNDTFVKELYKKTNVNMSQSYLYKILSGEKSNITAEYISALSSLMEISSDELIGIVDASNKADIENEMFYYLKKNKFLNDEEKLIMAAFYNALKEKRKAVIRNVASFMEEEIQELKKKAKEILEEKLKKE